MSLGKEDLGSWSDRPWWGVANKFPAEVRFDLRGVLGFCDVFGRMRVAEEEGQRAFSWQVGRAKISVQEGSLAGEGSSLVGFSAQSPDWGYYSWEKGAGTNLGKIVPGVDPNGLLVNKLRTIGWELSRLKVSEN